MQIIKRSDNLNCNMCGDCCKTFTLPQNVKMLDYPNDPKFDFWVKNHVEPVVNPPEELLAKIDGYDRSIYSCTALGSDNKCMIYDKRPYTCSEYPFYGKDTVAKSTLLSSRCGFGIKSYEEG